MTPGRCESCAKWEVAKLIYFNDLGPVFAVCRDCAEVADDWGVTVLELDDDGQVMMSMPDGGAA